MPQTFKNANGERVYPIMYNGSTYLPIRSACELAGLQVDWDQATQTVLLASKPADGVDLLDLQRAYYMSDNGSDLWARHTMSSDKSTKTITGYPLTHWLAFHSWTHKATGACAKASFNIEGKYDTVTFRYYAEFDSTLEVLGDNDTVLWTKDLTGGQLYQEVTVDLLKTSQLTFASTNKGTGTMNSYVFDVRLK